MKRYFTILVLSVLFIARNGFAQQGIHGALTVTAANTIVNEYTAITAFIAAGSTNITVASSTLNANGRFATNLQPGDLIMIYQAQGTIIKDAGLVANGADTTWGKVVSPGDYYSTGRYEFRQVLSVPNATTIVIDCGTTYDYIPNAGTARKPMVIRVPRYTSLTVNNGGILTCDDWNGTVGGVLAVEVQGNTVINTGGAIFADGKGFRGGSLVGDNATSFGVNSTYGTGSALGAEKGEGVAGYQAEYDVFGGRYCRAPGANGGGGGDAHNAGGGGGANAPNSTSGSAVWSGNGVPDQTVAGWGTAWSIEPPAGTMNLRTTANSAGGGRGGYSFSGSNQNATTLPPGNATWGGDSRNHQATGLGGRPLDYSTGRLFLGGGGGAGDQNQSGGGVGGDGGGLIYLMVYGTISGSGVINSNGLNGASSTTGSSNPPGGIDAAGGGGAGGTIVLNAVGGVANTLTVNTNGGNGGNQVINFPFTTNETEGPGGGGGGGYISVSSGTPARNSNGGNNGITNSQALTEFTPNGATRGCPGTNNATITNFNITTTSITICTGNSTTLTATITGTLPPGAVINWYTTAVGGSPFFTGNPYTTPALGSSVTYWVGTCAGWFRVPVTVTVGPAPVVGATASPTTICSGGSTTLTGTGATTYVWNPGNISGNPISVSPASTTTYTVTGTVGPGCSSTAQVTVTVNPTPTVTATASPTTICAGSSTNLTATGAASYVWNPGSLPGSPVTVSPTATTTYTVTGTTAGCTRNAQVTVTVNPAPVILSSASSPTICSGGSTNLSASGAVSYIWNPGAIPGSPITVSPTTTTTYTVTGTGANGCTSTSQVTVTVNPTPTVTATASTPTICAGGSTNLTGGGATSYVWNPGSIPGSPITVSPAATTTYTVTGTTTGCSSTAQVTVTVNPTPTITATASAPTICSGNSTNLTAGGGASYVWNPGNIPGSPITVSPATTTTYTVTGTGANSCTSTAQVTVTVNPTPTVTATASAPTICSGNSTNLTGGGAATYLWNPGNISGSPITVSPATTTTYTVTGSAGNGCSSTAQVTVTVNPTPTVTATASAPTICAGGSTNLTGSGATSYLWNPGNISGSPITVSPAATTTYTVTGTLGSCSNTSQVTVTVNPLPTPTAASTPTAICVGQNASLSATGGTTYSWNGGALVNASGANQTVSPASTTTYTVDVTDANTCTAQAQVTVTVNPLPVADAGIDQTICSGNTASLLATGGGTYTWNGGALSNATGAAQTVSPLTSTTYTVTVTNGFGCQRSDSVLVNVNLTPTTTAGPDLVICTSDTAQLNATGTGTFAWSPSTGLSNPNIANPQAFPAATTTYTVMLTAGNGCSNRDTITLTVNPRPTAVASNDTTICSGTTISITSSGGSTYTWNGGSLVNANGPTQSVAPTTSTAYTVTVTAANGCTDKDTVNVAVNALPSTNAGADVSICPNSSVQLNATGATSYSWSPAAGLSATNIPNPVANPVATTTYVVTGTNPAGCVLSDTIVVTVANNLTVSAGSDVTICAGDTVVISTSGGASYTWSPSATLQTPNAASTNAFPSVTTTYTVHVTDANSCQGDDSVTVFVNGPVNLVASGAATICIGQSTSINATPSNGAAPYTYSWSNSLSGPGPHTVSPVTTTTYTVSVTDSTGCTSPTQSVTVTVNPALTFSPVADTAICAGNAVLLTTNVSGGDGNYTYNWNPGNLNGASQTVSPAATTTYTIVATDGCGTPADTALITVNINPAPVVSLASSVNILCAGGSTGSATVSVSGGTGPYAYTWSPSGGNAATASGLQAGTYTVTVTDSAGCPQTQIVTLTQPPAIAVTTASTPENCDLANGSATVTASGGNPGYTYLWSNSNTSNSITNLTAGTYSVTTTDANGCTSNDVVVVSNTGNTNADAGQSVTITSGQSTVLTGTGGVTYSWSPGTDLSCSNCATPVASPTVTTVYTLTVTDVNGCTGVDTVTVTVGETCGQVFIPNAFSPNGDTQNDTLFVRGNCIKFMDFQVYNRWGENVFSTTDTAKGWDGTWRGKECEAAIFTYYLRATLTDGTLVDKQGTITIVK